MKKHELLKYAYDNYPAGTVARFKCKNSANHTSCGSFVLTFDNDNGLCVCSEKDESNTFYTSIDSHTADHVEEWARVVTKPEEEKVFVMTMDNKKIFVGDNFWAATFRQDINKWELDEHSDDPENDDEDISMFVLSKTTPKDDEFNKSFSTKEAAEKWILEQNKPKQIIISADSTYPIVVTRHKALIKCGDSDNHLKNIEIYPNEIKEIQEAFNKINNQ